MINCNSKIECLKKVFPPLALIAVSLMAFEAILSKDIRLAIPLMVFCAPCVGGVVFKLLYVGARTMCILCKYALTRKEKEDVENSFSSTMSR